MYDVSASRSVGSAPGYGVAEIVEGKMGDGHAVFPYLQDKSLLIVRGMSEGNLVAILIELQKFRSIVSLSKSDPHNKIFTANSVIVVGIKTPMETELLPAAPRSARVEKIRRIKSVLLRRDVFDVAAAFYGSDTECGQLDVTPNPELELVIVKMPYNLVAAGACSGSEEAVVSPKKAQAARAGFKPKRGFGV
jgi:hypothetical protein